MDPVPSVPEPTRERALLIGVDAGPKSDLPPAESLAELGRLCRTAGIEVADSVVCRLSVPHPATLIGRGKADELAQRVKAESITLLVFDDDLSPAQARNLDKACGARTIDRTEVILDIFAQHAQTHEGRLQVELAQAEYSLPRLRRLWTHLERQRGGIGLRGGPGEQQLELDRRRVQQRIHRLRQELAEVARIRAEQRRGRRRQGWAQVSLVGYTNAGKSTLMNRLTDAGISMADALFVTLDPTTRRLQLPDRQTLLLTDTVGFIRKLPHHLVDAFRATLEEVAGADLLLHVVDGAHPYAQEQIEAVNGVLRELGAGEVPVVAAINKADAFAQPEQWRALAHPFECAVPVSAATGQGVPALLNAMADGLRARYCRLTLRIPPKEQKLLARLRAEAHVLAEHYDGDIACLDVRVPAAWQHLYTPYSVPPAARPAPGRAPESLAN